MDIEKDGFLMEDDEYEVVEYKSKSAEKVTEELMELEEELIKFMDYIDARAKELAKVKLSSHKGLLN